MNQETNGNVHARHLRDTKKPQGGADRSVADLFRLDGRTIIVTGGGGFLGTAAARAILESGGDVVCLDVVPIPRPDNWDPVQETATKLGRHLGYVQCSTDNPESVASAFASLRKSLKNPIRGLVACAGISENGPSTVFSGSTFSRVLEINVTGTFLVAQAVANELLETQNSGSLVFIASMSGYVSNRGVDTAAYNSSKAAVHQLGRSLAAEWGSRVGMPLIRVNTLSPGYIRTAISAESMAKPGMKDQWEGDNMLLRTSTVDEYRAPIVYLLGDGSSFMTGADLRVDGGHCAW
ncbi:hypothetical protein SBRCBS47491_002501 [Sporothrix bragantina]|uniref:Ketoreductase domain-containing protein n=1 Tax=Sporothrix bragantina TaxID=671064 RepID=A0ABP0B8F7_9PEZI